ncbi:hypothetical protein A4G19_13095 [Pasteurellaceae bacterium Macca]|nr:hypothetical protein [Pasteurellaceae bacterium Macca]MCK3656631.1 hypothetical protein [Pasteurellaceae bacterium Macca]
MLLKSRDYIDKILAPLKNRVIITTINNNQEDTVDSKTMIKIVEKDGWYFVEANGSHHHFKHHTKKGKVTIPHPRKDLGFLEKQIRKQAGL